MSDKSLIELQEVDCLEGLKKLEDKSIDATITSPPYNLDIKYGTYQDDKEEEEYLKWLSAILAEVRRVLKDDGALFLNVGASNMNPWVPYDVVNAISDIFTLQNNIIWVKSIAIDDRTYGHFKPINSKRFTNHTFEHIFHLTKTGEVPIDRLGIGVPYQHKSNIKRWKGTGQKDLRCRGNCWFIPYETINKKAMKGKHPAIFPTKLVENCIRLHGIREDMVILDPFVGTGTTMVVAAQLGLRGIGMDIDKDYLKFAGDRVWEIEHGFLT